MDVISIVIFVIVLLALCGFIIYLSIDYFKFKDKTNLDIVTADSAITQETSDRLSNLKYVVDQVNAVNYDISSTISSNLDDTNKQLGKLSTQQATLEGNLNHVFSFSSNIGSTGDNSYNFLNLPSSSNPNLNLMSHVSMLGGMTINQLNNGADPNHQVSMCFDNGKNCIQIPDTNGNTFLTAQAGKNITMGAPVVLNDLTSGVKAATIQGYTTKDPNLPSFLNLQSPLTNVAGSLQVMSNNKNVAPFAVWSSPANVALVVDQSGNVETNNLVTSAVTINDSNGNVLGTITMGAAGDKTLNITGANGITIDGGTSGIKMNGALSVKGQISASNTVINALPA